MPHRAISGIFREQGIVFIGSFQLRLVVLIQCCIDLVAAIHDIIGVQPIGFGFIDDRIEIDGKKWRVVQPNPVKPADVLISYNIQLRA